MDAQTRYRLVAGVRFTPVSELPDFLREKLSCAADSVVVTRPNAESTSTLLSSDAAALASAFRSPCTFVDALRRRAESTRLDASALLESASSVIARLVTSGVLVSAERSVGASRNQPLAAGSLFDAYIIEACVQAGHGSSVYRAVDARGSQVALKVVAADDRSSADRLTREADVLRLISGTVAPPLVAAGCTRDRAFVATAWYQGVDLATAARTCRLLREPVRGTALLELATSVLRAYAELHRLGVVHGDVHPENVIVGPNNRVKVLDFGYSRLLRGQTSCGPAERAGVTFYLEPELAAATLRGEEPPPVTVASEQYALGVLLYTLFTGADYIDFDLVMNAALRQIVDDEPLPFVRHSVDAWPPVEAVLRRALSKDPNARFSSVDEFCLALSAAGRVARRHNASDGRARSAPLLRMKALEAAVSKLGARDANTALPPGSFDVERGAAGVAVALRRLAIARGDTGELALAEVWAHQAVRGVRAGYARRSAMALPADAGFALLRGPHGAHCVDALVAHAACDPTAHARAVRTYIELAAEVPPRGFGVAGAAGLLLGCALLLETAEPLSQAIRASLRECGSRLAMTLPGSTEHIRVKRAEQTPARYGMERGIVGSIYAGLRWARLTREPIADWVDSGLRQLATGGATPSPGWREGSAGMVHLWTLAYDHYHEDRFLDLGVRAASRTFKSSDNEPGLCQGLTGRAYALLACYRCTGDSRWRARAERLAEKALRFAEPSSADLLSLYHGGIGVVVLCAELDTPIRARMPMFEDEGWQASPSLSDALT